MDWSHRHLCTTKNKYTNSFFEVKTKSEITWQRSPNLPAEQTHTMVFWVARQTPPLHDEDEQSIARQTDKQIKSFVITVIEVFFTYIHRNFRYVLLNRDIVSIDFHWFHIDQNKCHYLNMDFVDYMDFLLNKFITISKNFSFSNFFYHIDIQVRCISMYTYKFH